MPGEQSIEDLHAHPKRILKEPLLINMSPRNVDKSQPVISLMSLK